MRKPRRSATLDSLDSTHSLDSADSKSPNIYGAHEGNEAIDDALWNKGDDRGRGYREAQIIPFQDVDEWALFDLLENKFGAHTFKIVVSTAFL